MINNLKIISIMKFWDDHVDELCANVREQYETGVANCFLFNFTLTPEGTPLADKAKILCQKFMEVKEKLQGVPVGVLVQASIGHGRVLGEASPFQKIVGVLDGKQVNTVCPYDEGFREYISDAFRQIAACDPCEIMVDDDFRLMRRPGCGCACPLHLKRFSELSGEYMEREELLALIKSGGEKGKKYEQILISTQEEALIETAKIMRKAVDEVDPHIPISFSCISNDAECAVEIATALAGEGNPVVIRLNNGCYTAPGPRGFSRVFYRGAQQIAKIKHGADYILAETDTCPHNRYSTSATMVHAHLSGSILEGAKGAKHWITRTPYEPESGVAYRKILSKYSKFYERLVEIVPSLKWRGFRIPLEKVATKCIMPPFDKENEDDAWSTLLLERLGLPMYFSENNGGLLCLEGKKDQFFTDEEIKEFLKGTVMLASDAAKRLIERGFGEYLGVDVKKWEGKTPISEFMPQNGTIQNLQTNLLQLIPTSDKTVSLTTVVHTVDHENYEDLFPGVTVYDNSLGGKCIVFAGSPKAIFNFGNFGYLNYTRKRQLIELLKSAGECPICYKDDEEVYLRAADMPNDRLFVALFNLSLDVIEELKFEVEREVKCVSMLMPDGNFEKVDFAQDGDNLTVFTTAQVLAPVVLVIA